MCPAFECGARRWPLAIMLSADRVPVKSSRSKRPGPSGVSRSVDRLAWVRYWSAALSNVVTQIAPRVQIPQAGSVARYGSFLAIIAQAMRAILLASATAAIFTDRRSINFTNHGWRV